MITKNLLVRKKALLAKLAEYGITSLDITYLPYLEFDPAEFASVEEARGRMLVFWAVSEAANHPENLATVAQWLQDQNLWVYVSREERAFFAGEVTESNKIDDLSWQIENATILSWALNLIPYPTPAIISLDPISFDAFINIFPTIGTDLSEYLTHLSYRSLTEVFDENIFHELATTYFRDLLFNGDRNTSTLNISLSFQRHQTLNWLRRFNAVDNWDETDTST